MAQREYTVTLTIDTTANSAADAARDFAEYLETNVCYTVTVAELGFDGFQRNVTQIEVGP